MINVGDVVKRLVAISESLSAVVTADKERADTHEEKDIISQLRLQVFLSLYISYMISRSAQSSVN